MRGGASLITSDRREHDGHDRPDALGAFKRYPAPCLLDDALRQRQAEPRSFAWFLRGEERLEDAPNVLRGYARTVVGDRDERVAMIVRSQCDSDRTRASSTRFAGVSRVQEGIHEDLKQPRSVTVDAGRRPHVRD